MTRLEVYFQNGRCAKFDIGKVSFRTGDTHFDFRDAPEEEEMPQSYAEVLQRGALVNWDAVSFVTTVKDEEDDA